MRDERTRGLSSLLLAVSLVAPGCGGGGDAATTTASPKTARTTHACEVQVSKRAAGEYTGKGSGASPEQADALAWADACAKLPAAEQASCRDETKWLATKSSMVASSEGPLTHATTVTLVALAPSFEGEGSSEVSSAEACARAVADACAQAGAPGECLAAGYEKKAETLRRTTVMTPG